MKHYCVGVDVGGTNIKLGLVNQSGSIISRSFLDTKKLNKNRKKLIDAVVCAISGLVKDRGLNLRDLLGVGFGMPGLIDSKKGDIIYLPNIPGWKNVPFKSIIQKKLGTRIFVDNDVNLITLGEWMFGAGRGCKNLLCMTLGTGVGGGLILDNALYRGEGFVAGELGHMPLSETGKPCSCGGWACFEGYVGNSLLQRKAAKIFKNKDIRFQDVYCLANQGNVQAVQFWDEAAVHIGNALVGVVNLLNPRLIIIGGGVSNNFKYLGKTIRQVIRRRAMKVQGRMVKVVRAKLGDDAGIIGAQVLVKESLRGR